LLFCFCPDPDGYRGGVDKYLITTQNWDAGEATRFGYHIPNR